MSDPIIPESPQIPAEDLPPVPKGTRVPLAAFRSSGQHR